ncbi:MAG: response regulator transcription factor [Rhodothermales bacterium]
MPDASPSILLAEDDPNLGQILSEYLNLKGYPTTLYRDGDEAWTGYRKTPPALCILDVMMPKRDGFTLARHIRAVDPHTPILFLTAKQMKEDRIEGFLAGADDYLTKPFSMQELLLRIQAILRRTLHPAATAAPTDAPLQFGQLTFEPSTRALHTPHETLTLTNKEAQLLHLLATHRNQTLQRRVALEHIWGEETYYNARSMDVYIAKLRKLLKRDDTLRILTVHGEGFKLIDVA